MSHARPSPSVSPPRPPRRSALARAAGALALLSAVAGCTPEIGDKCQVSTDCSIRGDRLCDTSQPGGYCTQLNCQGNGCADEASCVLFNSALPGCGYDDRSGPFGSRIARSFCAAVCESNGDCRGGYVCADPRTYPWNAIILDDDQNKRSCLPVPLEGQDAGAALETPKAPVCEATAPPVDPIDASAPSLDGGAPPLFPDADAPDAGSTDGG
ncbi:MAG: hypothetical protein KF782_26260 [Labilithrix sp.]|nr:hypothetical protein [Labilithrix sp.]